MARKASKTAEIEEIKKSSMSLIDKLDQMGRQLFVYFFCSLCDQIS